MEYVHRPPIACLNRYSDIQGAIVVELKVKVSFFRRNITANPTNLKLKVMRKCFVSEALL